MGNMCILQLIKYYYVSSMSETINNKMDSEKGLENQFDDDVTFVKSIAQPRRNKMF